MELNLGPVLASQYAKQRQNSPDKTSQAKAKTQIDMALDKLIPPLEPPSRSLLERMMAYDTPVPREGALTLALDLDDPEGALDRLMGVSLLEQQEARRWQAVEYQISALVRDWLMKNGGTRPNLSLLEKAAAYQRYLFEQERHTSNLAIIVHAALQRANRRAEADRFALDYIVGPLNRAGLYRTLLDNYLSDICRSEDLETKAEALGQVGKQYFHLGGYDTALGFLQQSLAISREIGDTAGLCATLFNIGHIHAHNKEYQKAMEAWLTVYQMASQCNLAQLLEALEQLAGQIGLEGGLDGWARLEKQIEEKATSDTTPKATDQS